MTNDSLFDDFEIEFDTPPTPPQAPTDPEDSDDPKDPPIASEELDEYFSLLKEQGVIRTPDDFKFDGTPEKFEEAISLTKQDIYNEVTDTLFNRLPEEFKPILDYALKGGTSIQDFISSTLPLEVSEKDLSSLEGQKKILRSYYKETSNYSDERIERLINRFDEDELEDEAKTTLSELKDIKEEKKAALIKKAEEAEAEKIRKAKENAEIFAKTIDEAEFLEGSRRTKVKALFANQLKTDKGTTNGFLHTLNQILSNPTHTIQLADIMLDYNPTKGLSLDRLQKKAATQTAQSVKSLLEKAAESRKSGGRVSKPKDDIDLEHFLD